MQPRLRGRDDLPGMLLVRRAQDHGFQAFLTQQGLRTVDHRHACQHGVVGHQGAGRFMRLRHGRQLEPG